MQLKPGERVTDGTDFGVVEIQWPEKNPAITMVLWDREYQGHKQAGYPLTEKLTRIQYEY
jgi:hypothetical protein